MLTKQVMIDRKTGETTVKIVETDQKPSHRDPWEVLAERMLDNWLKEKGATHTGEESKEE